MRARRLSSGAVGAQGGPFVIAALRWGPRMFAGREARAAAMWVVVVDAWSVVGAGAAASNVVRARKPLLPCPVPVFCRQTRIQGARRTPVTLFPRYGARESSKMNEFAR